MMGFLEMSKIVLRATVSALAFAVFSPGIVLAASDGGDTPPQTIIITGERDPHRLDQKDDTGSRLGLSIRETPATVDVLTQADMQVRGLRTAKEAYDDVVGAIAGNVPGNPAVVTMRGFSGSAVSILQDGVRVSTSTIVARDTNTWHYDEIDVIKGPASVLYGEGALAGVINKVTRKPTLDDDHFDGLLSYGSFNTSTVASGVNLKLSDTVAIRADVSDLRSDSLYDVKHNATRSSGLTGSLLYKPSADLSVLVAVDHYDDRYGSSYQGVPLVAASTARDPSDILTSSGNNLVIDKALRYQNYNPDGAHSGARDTTVRSRVDYLLGDGLLGTGWSLGNDLTWYTAKRDFVLSDAQNYTAPTAAFPNGSFARSVQRIYHDHQFWNERLALTNDTTWAGFRNRFSIGGEYNETTFVNPRQQSAVGVIAAVDPYNPDVGTFPLSASAFTKTNVIYNSKLATASAFSEDAVNLTPKWLLVGGVRYDDIDLKRTVTNLNANGAVSSANPAYGPVTWRVGSTYDVTPDITFYAQYTTAVVPVSSMLVQSIASTAFKMTTGDSYEAGIKAAVLDKRVTVTGALYRIEQQNILTPDPNNTSQSIQGGKQSSQGGELSISALATDNLQLSTGVSYTDARYDQLSEVVSGVLYNRTGNHPINTPSTTVSASALYRFDTLPVTLGAFLHHVSGFYTDTANTYFVRGHTTLDASISYKLTNDAVLTVRGRNLTNAFYGEYSGYPSTNIYIGAPRSVEASVSFHM